MAPSLVSSIKPSLWRSSRPTIKIRSLALGIKSCTNGRPEGSLDVLTYPLGL